MTHGMVDMDILINLLLTVFGFGVGLILFLGSESRRVAIRKKGFVASCCCVLAAVIFTKVLLCFVSDIGVVSQCDSFKPQPDK